MLEAIIIVVCAAVCIGAAAYAWWMENGPEKDAAEFHENGIDILMGSMRIDYSSRTYDTEGFTAHWEDLADERNAAASRRRVCLRYQQAMQSIAF